VTPLRLPSLLRFSLLLRWLSVWTFLVGFTVLAPFAPSPAAASIPRQILIESSYDPEVEFLEVATRINGARTWRIHGPDLSGSFGALQGIGGLEATIRESGNGVTALINDVYGHAAATIEPGSGALTWNAVRSSGYGPLPGTPPLSLSEAVSVAEAAAWRGKTIDSTGLYYLGARYYEPQGGRFLSPDPFGHTASISLYDYAANDPINALDPDGRLQKMPQNVQDAARNYGRLYGEMLKYRYDPSLPSLVGQAGNDFANAMIDHGIDIRGVTGGPSGIAIEAATRFHADKKIEWREQFQRDHPIGDFIISSLEDPKVMMLLGGLNPAILGRTAFRAPPSSLVPGVVEKLAGPAGQTGPRTPLVVNEATIAKALEGSTMKTVQGEVSLPVVQRYVQMLEQGKVPPAIKVDGGVIVDGNHRYVAGRVFGVEPPVTPGTLAPSQVPRIKPIQETTVSPADWGNY
jgi:RHS repeat-associated protein